VIAAVVLRVLAVVAFAALGIVWASTGDDAVGAGWVVSFVAVVALTLWYAVEPEDRPSVISLWDAVPGPSKDPDDYR